MLRAMKWYAARLLRALDWIEGHLDDDIAVADVAAEAGYSPYHFHRIFSAAIGEPLMRFVRRRRLTRAADELRRTDQAIMAVALTAGFDSQEAFTRAFKRAFDVTPGRHRAGEGPFLAGRHRITRDALDHLLEGTIMEPRFVELEAFAVVGMASWYTPERMPEIPELWGRFVPRSFTMKRIPDGKSYGLCFCSEGNGFFYMAGVPVASLDDMPHDMVGKTVPAGAYAVFTHKGHVGKLKLTLDDIWGKWLPKSDCQPRRDAPDFELYDERFNGQTLDGEIDIYIPVAAIPEK